MLDSVDFTSQTRIIFAVFGQKPNGGGADFGETLVARKWEVCASELVFF